MFVLNVQDFSVPDFRKLVKKTCLFCSDYCIRLGWFTCLLLPSFVIVDNRHTNDFSRTRAATETKTKGSCRVLDIRFLCFGEWLNWSVKVTQTEEKLSPRSLSLSFSHTVVLKLKSHISLEIFMVFLSHTKSLWSFQLRRKTKWKEAMLYLWRHILRNGLCPAAPGWSPVREIPSIWCRSASWKVLFFVRVWKWLIRPRYSLRRALPKRRKSKQRDLQSEKACGCVYDYGICSQDEGVFFLPPQTICSLSPWRGKTKTYNDW